MTLIILTVTARRAVALTDAALIKLKKKVSVYYSSESQFIIHPPAVEGFRQEILRSDHLLGLTKPLKNNLILRVILEDSLH